MSEQPQQQGVPIEALLKAMKEFNLSELKLGDFYARRGYDAPAINEAELKKMYASFNKNVTDDDILMNPMIGLEGVSQ